MTLFGQPFRAAEGDRPALIITRVKIPSHEIGLLTSGVRRSVHAVRRFKTALAFLVALCVESCLVGATLPDGFTESLVADGLSSPTAMEFTPDGRLFVCQQTGELRVIKDGGLMASPFVTVPVDSFAERGLLGIAFDPGFLTNSFLYVYYTAATPTTHNRVSRFTANGDLAIPASEVVLLDLNDLNAGNHNGGAIHFGLDGQLYIATGDNAVSANSQTLSNLLGKMLRINSDGSIPADNPFYNATSGNNRAIWALGLRNPFTFAFQPGGGRMFINDVGEATWEEIDDGVAGSNYGWPACEGACAPPDPNFRDPIFQYGHSGPDPNTIGCAIVGGAFYNPPRGRFPNSFIGVYFFADLCNDWISMLDPAQGNAVSGFATGLDLSPVDLKVGADGLLYYLAGPGGPNGAVFKIDYTNSPPNITQNPSDQSVMAGQPAQFIVGASGAPPLSYQWQRDAADIPGALSNVYTLASVSPADDGAAFRCVVANLFGSVTSNPALLLVTTNHDPVPAISAPVGGTLYRAGDTIFYAGLATDAEDGALPASAFSWTIVFHHATHTHPFLGPINGVTNGSFTIPAVGETSTNVWYRIELSVTDSAGAVGISFVDILPRTSTITLASVPAGLRVTLDGQPMTTPTSIGNVVGMIRTLGIVCPQLLDGVNYGFVAWSDGGDGVHNITIPESNATYTAVYHPPVISCPRDLVVECTNPSGTQVFFEPGTASDLCDNNITVSCVPASGSLFSLGVTTVTCTAEDGGGNQATCNFMVRMVDTTPPVMTCPRDVITVTDPGVCGATVTFAVSASDNCALASVVCAPQSGSFIPLGTTPVTCTATDASGNASTCTFNVTVSDAEPPVIACPANLVTTTAPGACDAVVIFATPPATDNCGPVSVVCNPPSGTAFPKGVTPVACTATDAAGNVATCTFTVSVNDTEPPVVSCPANVVAQMDAGRCGAVVNYPGVLARDNCPGVSLVCAPVSGTFFPKGVTPVTCTATDASGNASTCTFTVTVNDTEPPVIACPADVVLQTYPGQCGAVVNYLAPVVSDNCDPNPVVVCEPPSGSFFPIGTTTVTCTATDASGNGSSCAFEVTVEAQTTVALLIRLQGSDVVISWPVPCDGAYVLERTIDLDPPIDWVPVLEPVVPVGDRLQVATPASGQMRFLRLRKL
jgi:glucose/arabinose dehydrogenase